MDFENAHISDEDLLLAIDGELPGEEAAQVAAHLEQCWACRVRRQKIESAIAVFMKVHERNLSPELPAASGPRALLRAQLARMPARMPAPARRLPPLWMQVAAVIVIAALATVVAGRWAAAHRSGAGTRASASARALSIPDSSLTPGAAILASRNQVCSAPNPNNRAVPDSLQRQVFKEYGISAAETRAYEVDYLITPALGGADDIHNLWPQSYSETVWNARVKDALEDRLHNLVCQGQVDLATAQRDISMDWIAAYKKYFQTDRPLETAR
jgi:anti-sigma factor RsiW